MIEIEHLIRKTAKKIPVPARPDTIRAAMEAAAEQHNLVKIYVNSYSRAEWEVKAGKLGELDSEFAKQQARRQRLLDSWGEAA